MSAIVVCGNKRSYFEDLPTNSPPSSPNSSSASSSTKRLRCFSRFSPPRPSDYYNPFAAAAAAAAPSSSPFHYLRTLFPSMDNQLIEKALEQCGNDLDSAIKRLNELRLGGSSSSTTTAATDNANSDTQPENKVAQQPLQSVTSTSGGVVPLDDLSAADNLPKDGPEWVELLVREVANSSNIDEAKARASKILEFLENSIRTRAGAEAAQNFQMENMMLKEQIEILIRENTILKRAVAIQHERQKECDDQNQELQHLKQLVSQYQEQLKTLEVNNYALKVHLKQAQQSSSIPGRFHPDVF